ncbi:MAG: hypothetical protein ABW034_14625 [Steroidobacteraceae bacterium]
MKESRHPHDPDPWWQESVFLAWRDAASGIGGVHRIGTEINRGTSNCWLALFQEGTAQYRQVQEDVPFVDMGQTGFGCGPARFSATAAGLQWLLDTDEASCALTIKDFPGENLWHGGGSATKNLSERDHYHNFCSVRGTVRLGSQTREVNGVGWRDHSYGVRHWDQVMHHRCVAGSFTPDHALDFMSWTGVDGRLVHGGFEIKGGKKAEIKDFDLTIAVDEDGVSARSADVKGLLPSGESFALHFQSTGSVLVHRGAYLGIEAVGIASLANGARGFGYMACSNNARLGQAYPPLILNALAKNGLAGQ